MLRGRIIQVLGPLLQGCRRAGPGLDRGMHIAQFVLRCVAPTFSVDPFNRARHGGDAGAACRALAHAHARPCRLGRRRGTLFGVDLWGHGKRLADSTARVHDVGGGALGMANASIAKIRQRAAIVDEGALAVLVLTTAAALASLVAVLAELGHAPNLSQIALGMGTILLSWVFMHSIFALHYAHEFYGEGGDHRTGGLVFPGDQEPDYWDFVYYSLVVAMTAQVSDVQITSKTIRRLTALHGVVSFFFNVTVLALTVNIISSLMSPNH